MHEIDNYMTPTEAATKWGVSPTAVRNKLRPSNTPQETIDDYIHRGLIKYFQKTDGQRKEWIVSRQAMVEWFGEKDS